MRLLLVCIAFFIIFIGSYLIWGDFFEQLLGGDQAIHYLQSFGPWAWIAAIALMLTDVILPIPATAVLATLGIIYGPILGGIIGSIGMYAAGTAAYLMCRLLGENTTRKLLGERGYKKSNEFFARAGGWTVALSRWMIILPEMISCLAGMTRMPAKLYFTSLAAGVIPMAFTYAAIGAHFGAERPMLSLTISAAIPVALWPVMQMWLKRRNPNPKNQ
jgi:uncharacterized membrane protein YdjX (TVP38/TMEM64 family)